MRVSFGEIKLAKIPLIALRKSNVDNKKILFYLFYKKEVLIILN